MYKYVLDSYRVSNIFPVREWYSRVFPIFYRLRYTVLQVLILSYRFRHCSSIKQNVLYAIRSSSIGPYTWYTVYTMHYQLYSTPVMSGRYYSEELGTTTGIDDCTTVRSTYRISGRVPDRQR